MPPIYIHSVDDDPIAFYTLQLISKALKLDVHLDHHTDPEQAYAHFHSILAKEPAPDILLIDINMPIMDGWNLSDKLFEQHAEDLKETDCYILSSSVNQNDKDQAEKHPLIKEYLVKPLRKDKLLEIVHRR